MLDETDRKIIAATQTGLPLTPQPYQTIAEQLCLTADDVMMRLSAMQNSGIIRRIGAVPNHYKLGYRFNGMTVWNIPDEFIDELGQKVGQLEFVSHCYHRPRHLGNRSMHCSTSCIHAVVPEWPYNLFAMVHGKTQEAVDKQIQQIADLLGDNNLGCDVLYSTKILKKTGFRTGDLPVAPTMNLTNHWGDQQVARTEQQRTTRKQIRLTHSDYSQNGAYFITLCTFNRECLFGEIQNGVMIPNNYGKIVIEEWYKSESIRNEIELDEFVLMPNHIHGILSIDRRGDRLVTQNHAQGPRSKSLSSFIAGFKSTVTKQINNIRNTPGISVWQRNYYEHVVRNEDDLSQTREYIVNNPMKRALDKENPQRIG
jgi:DNA-binding Lrp family transcriptional regulator/REP element-mobilizing transposase RayT